MKPLEARIKNALEQANGLLGRGMLMKRMGIPKKRMSEFRRALDSMEDQGILISKNGRYGLPRKLELIPAEIVKVTGTFGFARPVVEELSNWEQSAPVKDVFIPGRFLNGALPGDSVLLKVSSRAAAGGDLPEGEVYQITAEAERPFAGAVVVDDEGRMSVLPDRLVKFPLRIGKGLSMGAKPGEKVLARVSRRGERHSDLRVEVVERYGKGMTAAVSARGILAENDVRLEFPPEALEQAKAIASGTGIHPKELAVRKDFREEIIFTIDGPDTKDIDDAVSLTAHTGGWTLGVHIADVSYYVTGQSPLDQEAYARGTSVYYADQVVPMLPKELSNGICSLNPGEDRLAFSAIVELDNAGKLKSFRFEKTVIRSVVQGVYDEVNRLLEGEKDAALEKKYREVLPVLREMAVLADLLKKNRMERGSMNLSSTESKIIVGEDGITADIQPRKSGRSQNIIEEFMLAANEAAATFAIKYGLPFLYRVHESPAPDRLENLYTLLEGLGVSFKRPKGDSATGHQLDKILDQVEGTPLEAVVNSLMLRTMAKAQYSARNIGHFGLALKNYAHFTSPIRRYPDLAIHRILSAFVTGMKGENIHNRFDKWVESAAKQSTAREIAAMTAERDCEDCYKAEFMQRFVGEEFDGMISSATSFGLFIQLPSTVEGLVSLRDLPGRWTFDGALAYKNDSGKTLRVGDSVRVKVLSANVTAGQIDFALI